jgi:nitroimidazol reductase NimA-like FMN-containing flavoprotein (pyridoxamine 5'-phosphate oxidase superfamily)
MNYHVRRTEREIVDEKEFESILEKGKYAIIGLSKDDEPYVVTLSYGYDKQEKLLYFHCGKEGQKIDFIKSNARACITIIEDDGYDADSCDHSYKSIVIRGRIQFIDDQNEVDRGIRTMITQLEKKDTNRYFSKLKAGNKSYENLQMLKMPIETITGKVRQKGAPGKTWPDSASPEVKSIS